MVPLVRKATQTVPMCHGTTRIDVGSPMMQ
jgi:hypothetical protein